MRMRREKKDYISVYVRNSKEGPSCYYRIIQYLEAMEGLNYKVNNGFFLWEYRMNLNCRGKWHQYVFQAYLYVSLCMKRLFAIIYDLHRKPRLIIVQRELVPHHMPFLLGMLWNRLLGLNTVIWDYDDDIFGNEISAGEQVMLSKNSRLIIVTNEYLRGLQAAQYRGKTITLPTTDRMMALNELDEVIGRRKQQYGKEISILWVGTAANLNNLSRILGYMESAAAALKGYKKKLNLIVVCSSFLEYVPKNFVMKNVRWTREAARQEILKAHIGIMPLGDDAFSKGKGGFKLVQCISAGLPVVGSNIGFNSEVITAENGFLINDAERDKWAEAIITLSTNINLWEAYSRNAFRIYREKFSFEVNAAAWRKLINIQKE